MLSKKQTDILHWPYTGRTALICDGAVRSGKTSIMSLSFILWAMGNFNNCNFGLSGKTVGSAERNIIQPLLSITYLRQNFNMVYSRSTHQLIVSRGKKQNRFYVFGGKDESSYMLIQGITLAGVLLDEVALMPRSFVEQALARCSVSNAKFWFNCNPDVPEHWFNKEWILHAADKDATHLHFTMEDNPSLSKETIDRYKSLYTGVFYQRYILGLWVAGDGVIYDMFSRDVNVYTDEQRPQGLPYLAVRHISCDYGTANPQVYLDIYDDGERVWVDREYRWDSRKERRQKTDSEYADELQTFMGADPQFLCPVIVDPSAASFILELQRRGVYVTQGDNNVPDGIRRVAQLFSRRVLMIHDTCEGLIGELGSYVWDDKAAKMGVEKPVKTMDHGPDALRYYVNTALPKWRYGEENVI
ncbi:PBSX family phage terminase large subunit [Oscillibacter ruminantium]|uniref:PBSX family phage terminase large subunit n=1 Tax=Oscillibacter ruminantium TaxID=1263547 RepID=UPI0002FA9C9D|nr:PBSX family phage terminase large subunit [Oscillibacter ruminantium]